MPLWEIEMKGLHRDGSQRRMVIRERAMAWLDEINLVANAFVTRGLEGMRLPGRDVERRRGLVPPHFPFIKY